MSWDYLVIGAGSSGCALVERLSRVRANKVVVLEAGQIDSNMAIKIPAALGFVDLRKFDWGYVSDPDPTRSGQTDRWLCGRVVGGSSSINGMNYVRGSAVDFDRWAELGNGGWSAAEVMPMYRQMERCDRKSISRDSRRGRDGLLAIRMVRRPHRITRAFIEAAVNAGIAFNSDYNASCQEGIGYAQLTQHRGRRWSAADAFLRPALYRENVSLQTDCNVHKLILQGRRVLGAIVQHGNQLEEVRAQRTILCAGAINTPKILMLSGVGSGALLAQHGIKVALDRPQVGKGLQEHPLIQLTFAAKVSTYNLTAGFAQKARMVGQYLLMREGPIASVFEAIGFVRSRSELAGPDLQLHLQPLGYTEAGDGRTFVSRMNHRSCFTVLINKSYPRSRGEVALAGADPRLAPLIQPRLLSNPDDLETLVDGVKLVRRIVAAAPLAGLVEEEILPGPAIASVAQLKKFVVENTSIAYHPAGTCRMGPEESAVTRPDLSVRGLESLWIADASVMPDLISGNTNAVCMMIGQKLGTQLCAE